MKIFKNCFCLAFLILGHFTDAKNRPDFFKERLILKSIWSYENELKFPFAIEDTESKIMT